MNNELEGMKISNYKSKSNKLKIKSTNTNSWNSMNEYWSTV